jgi:hypothetical protein
MNADLHPGPRRTLFEAADQLVRREPPGDPLSCDARWRIAITIGLSGGAQTNSEASRCRLAFQNKKPGPLARHRSRRSAMGYPVEPTIGYTARTNPEDGEKHALRVLRPRYSRRIGSDPKSPMIARMPEQIPSVAISREQRLGGVPGSKLCCSFLFRRGMLGRFNLHRQVPDGPSKTRWSLDRREESYAHGVGA